MKRIIIRFFLIILKFYSLFCRTFLPKKSQLVLFGAMKGSYYGDNSKHLYEWTLAHKPELKAIWLTSNKEIFRRLKADGKPVLLQFSFRAVRMLAQAKVAAFTNSLRDLAIDSAFVPNSLQLIALRHGRSVKRIRFARLNHKISQEETLIRKREGELIKYAISTSDFISNLQEQCLLIGRNKHVVTGYPRNDTLFNPPEDIKIEWKNLMDDNQAERVILYAPTWRHGRESTKFFPFSDFDKLALIDFLESTNSLLLLRPHVNDLQYPELKKFLTSLVESSDKLMMATHKEWHDVNSMLPFIDVLICDYSALYHDFLLLDKPILLIPYDLNEFEKHNGFLYDYTTNAPGPIINSFKQFIEHSQNIVDGIDNFEVQRNLLCDKIHAFKDDKSCARVSDLISLILN
jgi:CDP-glycerol glycerophosphotransferase (TagB/SpsB family)